jgi:hypothetical protein
MKKVLWISSISIIIGALGGFFIFKMNNNSPQNITYDITSNQIYQDFKNNEVAALQTYKGKRIRVTGTIISFINSGGENYCYIGSPNDLMGEIKIKMSDEFSASSASFHKGQVISVVGICDGVDILGIVKLY